MRVKSLLNCSQSDITIFIGIALTRCLQFFQRFCTPFWTTVFLSSILCSVRTLSFDFPDIKTVCSNRRSNLALKQCDQTTNHVICSILAIYKNENFTILTNILWLVLDFVKYKINAKIICQRFKKFAKFGHNGIAWASSYPVGVDWTRPFIMFS